LREILRKPCDPCSNGRESSLNSKPREVFENRS
jgi:hypothetical protein